MSARRVVRGSRNILIAARDSLACCGMLRDRQIVKSFRRVVEEL